MIARLLALLALAAAVVVVVLVVGGSLSGGDDGGGGKRKKDGAKIAGCKPEAKDAVKIGYYVVQQDDLLSLIAERTCVPDDELARFNPQVDPQALTPGQCISLVEGACKNRDT